MNSLYYKARQKFLNGDLSWRDDDIWFAFVDSGSYTADVTSDEFVSTIVSAGGIVASGGPLQNKTSTYGVADADNVSVSGGIAVTVEAIVLYKNTGNEATSDLIAYIDQGNGLPIPVFGGDIAVNWDNGANRIFKL